MSDVHPFFQLCPMPLLHQDDFDSHVLNGDGVVGVFFWGHNCPNCEVAKNRLAPRASEFLAIPIRWYQVNVYEDSDLGTRFGLAGIPTFIFFKNGRRLGKISPFPGVEPFFEALQKLVI